MQTPVGRLRSPSRSIRGPCGGIDLVTGGVEAGEAAGKTYTDNAYHKPADEYADTWDLTGMEADVKVDYEVINRLANSADWPHWYDGTEFKGLRDAQRAAP